MSDEQPPKQEFLKEIRLLQIDYVEMTSDKSSCSEMFFKTGDFKISAKFTRKHMYWKLFFMKLL